MEVRAYNLKSAKAWFSAPIGKILVCVKGKTEKICKNYQEAESFFGTK